MQNGYKNTIREMILANDSLLVKIVDGYPINESDNMKINIELFFLVFSLFNDYFKKIDISDSWKDLLDRQDYYIDGDKVIVDGNEISFQLLELTFIKTLLKYREIHNRKSAKIINISERASEEIKIEKLYGADDSSKLIQIVRCDYREQEEMIREDAISTLNGYEIGKSDNVQIYLRDIKDDFREIAYDSIVALYNKLKKTRKDKMFKSNIPLLNDTHKDNKFYDKFAYMLLSIYPIQFYAKDKGCIDYSKLFVPNIEADANHYRYDDVWSEFEKQYEEINKIIDNCMIFIRSRKVKELEKRRVRFKINQLEWKKRNLEEQYMMEMIEQTDMSEVVMDEDGEESYYTSSTLNKHILYNMEVALRNGHVDIVNKNGKDVLVLYAIVGKKVDFIINIGLNNLINIFDVDNLLDSIQSSNCKKGMLIGED